MKKSWLILLVLLAAGCVAPGAQQLNAASVPNADAAAGWALKALPSGSGHDHNDPTQHKGLSTPNFQVLGYEPLGTASMQNKSAGGWACGELATTKDGRKLAVVNSFTTDVMFVLVDITDAAAPHKVGEFVLPEGHAYDVAMTPDGTHVLIAQNNPRPSAVSASLPLASTQRAYYRDACTGAQSDLDPNQILSALPGVVLVNIEDAAHPKIVNGFFSGVLGPHSVATARVDNVTWAIVSALQLEHQASFYEFYQIDGDALNLISVYQAPPAVRTAPPPVLNGHMDGTIAKHPVTHQLLAYLADWNAGLIIVDMTNPRVPITLSQYSEASDPTQYIDPAGSIHDVWPLNTTWEGKHYVLAGQELGDKPAGRPSGWVYIIDDTDPTNIKVAGRWTLPVESPWQGFLVFSLHYIAVYDHTLFASAYHAGVWAADISDVAHPKTLGVFVPDREPPSPPDPKKLTASPDVEDILVQPDGTLVTFDAYSGAYTVKFTPDPSVPALPAWTDAHPVK